LPLLAEPFWPKSWAVELDIKKSGTAQSDREDPTEVLFAITGGAVLAEVLGGGAEQNKAKINNSC
jgi:hypothetical protein